MHARQKSRRQIQFQVTDIKYDGISLWCNTNHGELTLSGTMARLQIRPNFVSGTFEGCLHYRDIPVPVTIEFTDTIGIMTINAYRCRFVSITEFLAIGYVQQQESIICAPLPAGKWASYGGLIVGISKAHGLVVLMGPYEACPH